MKKHNKQMNPLYKRSQNRIEPLKRLVLYCEGTATEPEYFQALRNAYRIPRLQVKIVGRGEVPERFSKVIGYQKPGHRHATPVFRLEDREDQVLRSWTWMLGHEVLGLFTEPIPWSSRLDCLWAEAFPYPLCHKSPTAKTAGSMQKVAWFPACLA